MDEILSCDFLFEEPSAGPSFFLYTNGVIFLPILEAAVSRRKEQKIEHRHRE